MHNHKFGIVTSFYNCSKYVDSVITSVKNQTYDNWLYFVTDDNSSDDTKIKVLAHCDNKKIFYVEQKFKKEMFWQPQRFVTEDCDFVITMDSDDFVMPKALEIYNILLNKYYDQNIVFISTDSAWYGNEGNTFLNPTYIYHNKNYSLKYKDDDNNPEKIINKKSPNSFGYFRGIKNIKGLDFKINEYNAAGNNDILHCCILQNYGNSLLVKRNLYKYNYRSNSVSHKILSSEEWQDIIKVENIINENIKTDECLIINKKFNNLYTDFNGFSFLNFDTQVKDNSRINLLTRYNNKDFDHLTSLYPDHYIAINNFIDDFDYYVINLSDYDLDNQDEILKIINFIKNKNFHKLFFYFFDKRDSEEIKKDTFLYSSKVGDLISKNFGAYFWCSYYRHFIYCFSRENYKPQYPVYDIINESGSLGDAIAWIPMVNEFAKINRTKINLYTPYSELFYHQYPLINFYQYSEKIKIDDSKAIKLGCFDNMNWKKYSLQEIAAKILDIPYKQTKPKINFDPDIKSKYNKKYVCIATQSTSQCKYWNNETGWNQVIDYLKSLDYEVVCIDKHEYYGNEIKMNKIPNGCINKTGDYSLQDRIHEIINSEFFIGLGSGLSWLAWACNKPVIMISGFSDPKSEFNTPYRVHNKNVCNSCWNDDSLQFDRSNWMWCPRGKDFECSKQITFEMVKNNIDKCIFDLKNKI
jgi:autotransporter strand-loop-strand O-heptosyltransferase